MLVNLKNQHTEAHHWIIVHWWVLGAILLGSIAVISYWIRRCRKAKHLMKKLHKQNGLKRSNSAIEFDVSALTAANRRQIYSSNRSASSEQDNSDHSEHTEKSPLVSARLDNLARLFFSKSMPAETGSRDTIESVLTTRPNVKYQYSALDSGNRIVERSPRERAHRERALNTVTEWVQGSDGRYEVIAHLDELGSRHGKNWFLVTDSSVRTDRLLTLLPLPPDCVALEDLPASDNPKAMLMELLGSLHHPYIYPVLDLGFLRSGSNNYACLVTPFNSRGSLKDLIYKTQWNEPWARKYTRKPNGLPVTQIQRLGRQILEALLFLKERGFPLHGHLHSGNVILQNGAARLSGLENGLLGLSSRINAVMWSRSTTEIENVDIICFGHLLYEMCTGQEMTTPKPSMRVLEMELDQFPQIVDVLGLIFEPSSGVCPSVEELVLCDLFRSIDLRELRGPCFSTIKPSLSRSTLNLLHAVKKRQCASLGNSLSETSSPSSPSTPLDRRSGISRTMDSFDISSDSEERLLDEIVVDSNYYRQRVQLQHIQYHQQKQPHYSQYYASSSSATALGEAASSHCQLSQQFKQYRQQLYCNHAIKSAEDNSGVFDKHNEYHYQQKNPTMRSCSSTDSNLNILRSNPGAFVTAGIGHRSYDNDGTHIIATTINFEQNAKAESDKEEGDDDEKYDKENDHKTKQSELNFKNDDYATSSSTGSQHVVDTANIVHSHASSSTLANSTTIVGASAAASACVPSFNHQLTADSLCSYKNSKSRRLEYSLKCLKYGCSNPSQDSAFGSLTDNDLSTGSSSFRISSFQSVSSPIDEGAEDIIIATSTSGNETCLELATIPRNMVSQDSAISSPCRESSPNNFLNIDDAMSCSYSGASSSSSSSANVRPNQFPVSLSPKILVTATTNFSNSSLSTSSATQQPQQFDPPKILVNDQNSIYTTSPSKRSGTIEVFSQKYRVSSFEDMSPNSRAGVGNSDKHLKNVNRQAFRSLEEERRIDNAFIPIADRTKSENRVNVHSEKYKKLTHSSFRISKRTSSPIFDSSQLINSTSAGSTSMIASSSTKCAAEIQRPATATGTSSNRQTMWRDSKFYRKNGIAKSNDSLLEYSPNHSVGLSPLSLRENLCTSGRRYCSSKSEDLGEAIDYLRVIDARKSYSERHLVTLTKLKQTAINNTTMGSNEQCCFSEDEISFTDDNNFIKQHQHKYRSSPQKEQHLKFSQQQQQQQQQHYSKRSHPNELNWSSRCSINRLKTTNIKTSLSTLSCQQNPINTETLSAAEISRIFALNDAQGSSSCNEEKTPLLDSVEMSPIISPTNDDLM